MAASRSDCALLYRRAGFGATAAELDQAVAVGWTATVDRLLRSTGTGTDPGLAATPTPHLTPAAQYASKDERKDPKVRAVIRTEHGLLTRWWLDRMTAVREPWPEKLAWFWHGHFATSIEKVRSPALMLTQHTTIRQLGDGPFNPLLQAMTVDPAMMVWLDGRTNRTGHPNENYARECMELFALGQGRYSETDVRELARCFTGWVIDSTGAVQQRSARTDSGPKTLFGSTAPLTTQQAVDAMVARPDCPRFLAARAWSRFGVPVAADDPVLQPLISALGPNRDLAALWRALLTHPELLSPTARTGLVKQPVEWLVGVLRILGLRAKEVPTAVPTLTALGQVPFAPPSVGGWPENYAWLSTSSALVRIRFALTVAALADLQAVEQTALTSRLEAVAHLLGLDGWSASSAAALTSVAKDPTKLLALAVCSPEFLLA